MRKKISLTFIILFIAGILMISFFEKIENFFLYNPSQLLDSSTEGLGIKYENIKFSSKDNTLCEAEGRLGNLHNHLKHHGGPPY